MDPPSELPPIAHYEDEFDESNRYNDGHDAEYGEMPDGMMTESERLDALMSNPGTFTESSSSSPPMTDARLKALFMDGNQADHSLPTAEEARLNALLDGSNPHNGRRKRVCLLVSICMVALAAIVGFSVAIANRNSTENGSAKSLASNGGVGVVGGDGGTGESINNPAPPAPPIVERPGQLELVREFLVDRGVSSLADLENTDSLQYAALKWIAEEDALQLEAPSFTEGDEALVFEQRYVMGLFYYAMNGDNWRFKFPTWQSVCQWNMDFVGDAEATENKLGVECDDNDLVSTIFMPSNNLEGEFPSEFGRLSSLKHLSLFNNSIAGTMPSEMQKLTELKYVVLSNNKLSGSLPSWLNKWINLEYLGLGSNQFEGALPSFEGMTKLKELAIDDNSLTGSVDALDEITTLEAVFLNDNTLNGRLHGKSFLNFPNLVHLDLSNNALTGNFHEHFYQIKVVKLENNILTGAIPVVQVAHFPVEYLSLNTNQLTGDVPASLGFLGQLNYLDLSNNQLDGTLSDSFNDMKNLRHLFLSNNPLTAGRIPLMKDLINLKELALDGTNRNGNIPIGMGSLINLRLLKLQYNALTGEVPTSLGDLPKIRVLALNRNMLSGGVPNHLANMQELAVFFMDKNNITGPVGDICAEIAKPPDLFAFVADCGEVTCDCCTKCCEDADETCNDGDIKVTNEGDENLRAQKLFSENLVFDIANFAGGSS